MCNCIVNTESVGVTYPSKSREQTPEGNLHRYREAMQEDHLFPVPASFTHICNIMHISKSSY